MRRLNASVFIVLAFLAAAATGIGADDNRDDHGKGRRRPESLSPWRDDHRHQSSAAGRSDSYQFCKRRLHRSPAAARHLHRQSRAQWFPDAGADRHGCGHSKVPLNITLGPAAIAESVVVVGQAADVLTRTAQVATNFKQDVIASLPTNRDINATLLMAPAVHPTGPSGAYSIAARCRSNRCSWSTASQQMRMFAARPYNLYIEDAIQETVVATDGVSAEYGRFSGGIVNIITKSGRESVSGSFRDTLNNDDWRTRVVGNGNFAPLAQGQTTAPCNLVTGLGGTQIPDPNCFSADAKVDKVVPTLTTCSAARS